MLLYWIVLQLQTLNKKEMGALQHFISHLIF